MRRHRHRTPAAVDDLPSNTCGNGHGGEDKGNREGETRRSGACASAGASRGEGEVGGALPAATIKWRRRHCMVFSFDTENSEEQWPWCELWCSK